MSKKGKRDSSNHFLALDLDKLVKEESRSTSVLSKVG